MKVWNVQPVILLSVLALGGCRPSAPSVSTAGAARVVSLAPSLTEMVCALGGEDLLVGRTSACDYPTNVTGRIPVVGGFGAPSMELLIAAKPTLILDVALSDETLGRKIEAVGLRRERIECRRLDDVPHAVETVGGLLHRQAEAGRLAGAMRAQIRVLRERARTEARRPKVFVEIWGTR